MSHPVKLFCFQVPSAINHERTKREERDWTDDAEDYAQDVLDQSWGGKCIQASDCLDYVAYCHKDADIGTYDPQNRHLAGVGRVKIQSGASPHS